MSHPTSSSLRDIYGRDDMANVSDLVELLKRKVPANEKPYNAVCINANNELIDEFQKTVVGNRKRMVVKDFFWQFTVFAEGREVIKALPMLTHLGRPTEENTREMVKVLNEPIEKLRARGTVIPQEYWLSIVREIKLRACVLKYERVFSKSDNPLDWFEIADKCRDLFQGKEVLVEGMTEERLTDIAQKVSAIAIAIKA